MGAGDDEEGGLGAEGGRLRLEQRCQRLEVPYWGGWLIDWREGWGGEGLGLAEGWLVDWWEGWGR